MPALKAAVRPPVALPITVSVPGQRGERPVSVAWDTPFGHAVTGAAHSSPDFFEFALRENKLTHPRRF